MHWYHWLLVVAMWLTVLWELQRIAKALEDRE
jgi:hypothetical protein